MAAPFADADYGVGRLFKPCDPLSVLGWRQGFGREFIFSSIFSSIAALVVSSRLLYRLAYFISCSEVSGSACLHRNR
jgi:hypothetical protein